MVGTDKPYLCFTSCLKCLKARWLKEVCVIEVILIASCAIQSKIFSEKQCTHVKHRTYFTFYPNFNSFILRLNKHMGLLCQHGQRNVILMTLYFFAAILFLCWFIWRPKEMEPCLENENL